MIRSFWYILIVGILVSCGNGSALTKVDWVSLEKAQELAKKDQKKILVDFYDETCEDCQAMFKETFTNPVIVNYLTKHFHSVKFEINETRDITFQGNVWKNQGTSEKPQYHDLVHGLGDMNNDGMETPSFVFLEPSAAYITIAEGYMPAHKFEEALKYVGSNAYAKMTIDQYLKTFNGEIKE